MPETWSRAHLRHRKTIRMAELRELCSSAGAIIAGEMLQRRQRPDPATLIGSGKVEELKGALAAANSRAGHLRS